MEAVGRLARGIAHDFNNVLAAILGCADLMQLRLRPGDELLVDAKEIARAAQRGAALTKQLLAFSRRQAVETEVLDLHKVLLGFDTMLQRIAGEITLKLHTPGPPPRVRMEPGQIEQVVMNLVLNARDASPPDGTIDVSGDIVSFDARTSSGFAPGSTRASPSTIAAPESTPTCSASCSSRSSPPRIRRRATAWGCRSCMASPRKRAARSP